MSVVNEILREFLLETQENLALLDADLLTLEKNPADKSTLAQAFRTLHSIKGTAGFMGLIKLQAVAHSAESLLSRLRAGELVFNRPIATALLRVVDAIRTLLASIESSGAEGSGEFSPLIADLDRLRETAAGNTAPNPPGSAGLPAADRLETTVPTRPLPPAPGGTGPARAAQAADIPYPTASMPASEPMETALFAAQRPLEPPTGDGLPPPAASAAAAIVETIAAGAVPREANTAAGEARTARVADTSIRVDVGLLDKLMALVGELVLARNQILQYSGEHEDASFLGAAQRLNLLTTELQASVMKTRMQPIGTVWNKFPRVVRDLALACGKQVRLEMDGQETELDKTLIEAVRDPLMHMVRNAVDHGIETPDVRRARGKPAEGCLRILAFHEGGMINVEITDDGGGIDVARVRDKALRAKLVSAEAVARMSPPELLRLVFLPGFSTADRVTQFSGRGVGMDVVRTNIENIGGTVDLESSPGLGTTIRTKIPLTLAIIPALIVVSAGERYAIPQVSLLELVWLDPEQAQRGLEWIQGAPVYRLRGNLLPLVFLDEQLQLVSTRAPGHDLNIVVLQAGEQPFGLVVDAIRDTEEIVVKPLQKQLKGVAAFAGAAIMGDGRVALILDVLGLAQRASVISGAQGRALGEKQRAAQSPATEVEPLLLFEPCAGGPIAIPLSRVARLEDIPRAKLERVGGRHVVQYRGEILPLVDVSGELDLPGPGRRPAAVGWPAVRHPGDPAGEAPSETVPVVVCDHEGQRIGLMVGKILDIVHDPIAARCQANRPGVLFTAVVQGRVTEFIDVAALVCAAPGVPGQSTACRYTRDGQHL